MSLTDNQIKKYQNIYKEIFGKEISREKAFEDGTKLILLVGLVLSEQSNCHNQSEFPEILGQQKND